MTDDFCKFDAQTTFNKVEINKTKFPMYPFIGHHSWPPSPTLTHLSLQRFLPQLAQDDLFPCQFFRVSQYEVTSKNPASTHPFSIQPSADRPKINNAHYDCQNSPLKVTVMQSWSLQSTVSSLSHLVSLQW